MGSSSRLRCDPRNGNFREKKETSFLNQFRTNSINSHPLKLPAIVGKRAQAACGAGVCAGLGDRCLQLLHPIIAWPAVLQNRSERTVNGRLGVPLEMANVFRMTSARFCSCCCPLRVCVCTAPSPSVRVQICLLACRLCPALANRKIATRG